MSINWENVEFKDEKRFLSNMYLCPITLQLSEKEKSFFPFLENEDILDGLTYPSTEHIYQMLKSKNKDWHNIIINIENPHKTKRLSRKHLKKNLLFETDREFIFREDWDSIKIDIMKLITYLKYTQNPDLANKLISIEGYIEERNDWKDVFWGTCQGIGKNNLGKILMQMRDYLIRKNKS
jgi:predicted NAD-dependent protein-ADP-ribosyltransferase YbiA (DUF1768 family)